MFKKLFYILLLFCFCSCDKTFVIKKTFFLMDTVIEITLITDNKINANKALKEIFDEMNRIDKKFNRYDESSYISKINQGKIANIDDETCKIINDSIEISKLTNGAFDITVAPIMDLWGFGKEEFRIPNKAEILKIRNKIGYKKIILHLNNISLNGAQIDLGGVVKGYAVDRAKLILDKYKISDGIINAGGDVFVIGTNKGRFWNIGIEHPRDKNKFLGVLSLKDKTIVSSGDYERFFIKNNKRYHHIMDAKTCFPSDSGLISVTIVADNSEYADLLSTSVFVLGEKKGLELIKKLKDVGVIMVTSDMRIIVSDNLKPFFKNYENN
jgi:FAD:protein FMN transferase